MMITIPKRTTAVKVCCALIKLYRDKALTDRHPAVEVAATTDGKQWWHYRLTTRCNGHIEACAFRHGRMIVVDDEPHDVGNASRKLVRRVADLSKPQRTTA